ncbi:type VI secretion system protein TssL [Mangrovimicrobium sediminis]|uniref:Type VI secretion system protein TssL n=1 Tax=Mangrovimicrobium sediminis TaxID=2562682 RepID=A0A4Z0LU73_9GAMM|nr:flagellar motor protein MotB [Haliea sp. SAOS-164]TGD70831.1 type VI secretion system protein TssL [Haliea sp. SAOS-164]
MDAELGGSEDEPEEGAPAWMSTFADLMSLLMCFFVLLLSFSEMDVVKYRAIAGSMKEAFGVQSKIEAESIPKGTSVIKQEFSPGTPQPTPRPVINQQTTNDSQRSLQVGSQSSQNGGEQSGAESVPQELLREKLREMLSSQGEEEALRQVLRDGIVDGKIDVAASLNQITIRIREQGSFASGQADLNPDFEPLIEQLRTALAEIEGTISVEGHTDNVPIKGNHFESNWDLSAARALTVAKELMKQGTVREARFMVVGHADTRPLKPNDTPENRAANRRVEIVIRNSLNRPGDGDAAPLPEADNAPPAPAVEAPAVEVVPVAETAALQDAAVQGAEAA